MRYPWSDMPKPLVRALAGCDPDRAVEMGTYLCRSRKINMNLDYQGVNRRYPVYITMSATSRWLHGRRRIVEVSNQAGALLGSFAPRFHGLPVVSSDPWKYGVALVFPESHLMLYVEPLEGRDPGIRYATWARTAEGGWGTVVPKDMSFAALEASGLDTYTSLTHSMGGKRMLAITEEGGRVNLEALRVIAINTLAALHEDSEVVLMGARKAPRKKKGRRVGGISKVKRLTLSFDGTCLVTRRWIILDTPPGEEKIEHKDHKSPCLHTVQPHYWRVWVNKPLPGEDVLETREKERVHRGKAVMYTQYRVKRIRGRDGPYSRGKGEPSPQRARIVTGPEDISTGV